MNLLKIIVIWILTFSFKNTFGSHLIGAEINYSYYSPTQIKVRITVYKDSTSFAPFDGQTGNNSFNLGIENLDNSNDYKVEEINFDNSKVTNVNQSTNNPCLVISNSLKIQKYVYEKIITLNSTTSRYRLIYQRCCRNNSIINLKADNFSSNENEYIMPGMTVTAEVPPLSTYNNNSAVFTNLPPTYICKGTPFYFDHSATDIDGDSLAYSLSTPLSGLTADDPYTNSPKSSKSGNATWNPPYSINNIMGGTENVSIDPITGMLKVIPPVNTEGIFVISILCKEYRNGLLINQFMRDIQFSINSCNNPLSSMPFVDNSYNPNIKTGTFNNNCSSSTINFTNTSLNAERYLWKFNDPNSLTNDTSTLKNPTHVFSDTGLFKVTLISYKTINNVDCSDSIFGLVYIYPILKIDFKSLTPICVNQKSTFTDLSTSQKSNINSWKWEIDNNIFNTSSFEYTFTSIQPKIIKLTITTDKGCKSDTSKNISALPSPKINGILDSVCQNISKKIEANVIVVNPQKIVNYIWTLPNQNTINTKDFDYTFSTNELVEFKIKVISDSGCIDSGITKVQVLNNPVINTSPDTSICYDQKVKLYATGAVSYLWSPSGIFDNPTSSSPIASPIYPQSNTITVIGADNFGCKDTSIFELSFFPKPFINAGLDTSVCLNKSFIAYRDSVILQGQGNFASVSWTPTLGLDDPTKLNPKAKPNKNITYVLQAVDNNKCIVKDSVDVTVLDPSINLIEKSDTAFCQYDTIKVDPIDQGVITTYKWKVLGANNPYWIEDPNIRNPKFFPLDTTIYILEVSNYCYNKLDTIILNAINLPQSNLKEKDMHCENNIYQFFANPNMKKYQWTTSDITFSDKTIYNPTAKPNITQKYYLYIEDSFGCKNNDSTEIVVLYPPALAITGVDKYLCKQDSMDVTVFTDSNVKLEWEPNEFVSKVEAQKFKLYPLDDKVYLLKATNDSNCTTVDTINIKVIQPVKAQIQLPENICKGEFTTLIGSGGNKYIWSPTLSLNDSTISEPQAYPDTTTNYSLIVSNECFSDTTNAILYVDTLPKLVVPKDTTIYREQIIELGVITKAEKIEWNNREYLSNPFSKNNVISTPKDVTFKITAIDNNGCKSTDSFKVNVYSKDLLLIPNAFSPNNDNINDFFGISKYMNVKTFIYLKIYDRWGEEIFSTDDIDKNWDGKYKNEELPVGVYVWTVSLINYDGKKITNSGNVTLIR